MSRKTVALILVAVFGALVVISNVITYVMFLNLENQVAGGGQPGNTVVAPPAWLPVAMAAAVGLITGGFSAWRRAFLMENRLAMLVFALAGLEGVLTFVSFGDQLLEFVWLGGLPAAFLMHRRGGSWFYLGVWGAGWIGPLRWLQPIGEIATLAAGAILGLFSAVMSIPGITMSNPTHGRISIPAAYPGLMKKLSRVIRAGPDNWIGVQMGIETGSDRLASEHMPNKTLPLKVGPDGSWADIVWRGTYVMNKYHWRPAFTVQVGQAGETPEDNWETVALINRMSESTLDNGLPFEFTVTPMQNVPLGLLKSRDFSSVKLGPSQLAVYYASYRHLAKVAIRDARRASSESNLASRYLTGGMIALGGWAMFRTVKHICKKGGLDLEKAARYGLVSPPLQTPMIPA